MSKALFAGLSITIGLLGVARADQIQTAKACDVDKEVSNCKSGNGWAVIIDKKVGPGKYVHVDDPGCMQATNALLQNALKAATAYYNPALATVSGGLTEDVTKMLGEAINKSGGDIAKIIGPYSKDGANCVPQIAIIPVAATDVGYRFYASKPDRPFDETLRCAPDKNCPIEYGRFDNVPIDANDKGVRTITSIYKNWSDREDRVARLVVFYSLPTGQAPLIEK